MHTLSSAMVNLKKLEQLFSQKRNFIFGFILGIGGSLILLFLSISFNQGSSPAPTVEEQELYNVSLISTTAHTISPELLGSTLEILESNDSVIAGVDEKLVEGNENGTRVFKKAQWGNITEEDRSFGVEQESVGQKDGNFDSENFSEIFKFERLHAEGGRAMENSSVFGKEDRIEANFSNNSSNGDGMVTEDENNEINGFESRTWETQSDEDNDQKCDIYDGQWVRDDSLPYYPGGSCPLVDMQFNCHLNGRPDDDFVKWKWQPYGCEIPRLNATDFLERLKGKRLVFVGDSLTRNMWESLVCILRHSLQHKNKVSEVSGKSEFNKRGIYSFKFKEYNCFVDLVVSPFLVRESSFAGKNGSFKTLRLDLMDQATSKYRVADIIVFNTAHWWNQYKTARGLYYYQEGNYVHPRLKTLEAYKRALTTWARWVDKNINPNRTRVFFRGYAFSHYSNGQWNSGGHCHKETEPIFNEAHLSKYPSKMRVVEYVLRDMKTPVTFLNISRLTDYRKDAHPSIYRMKYNTKEEEIAAIRQQDCNHYCLPGTPDTWNELLYASLLKDGWRAREK